MKNIFNKVKNNMEYAKWRKIRKDSLKKMKEHQNDEDDSEFKYWAHTNLYATKKCMEIEI